MKYRSLSLEELESLKTDFIKFLAANTITSDDWEKLKRDQAEKAEQLIAIFSDMVFDQTLEKVTYLEHKTPRSIRTYHCLPDKISLMGLLVEGETALNFTQNLSPEQMINLVQLSGAELKLFSGEKAYKTDRKLEIFELMEQGALISKDGHLFHTLHQLKQT
ncbi:MAG: DUF6495 family protein [Saprospiraceae bacterium]